MKLEMVAVIIAMEDFNLLRRFLIRSDLRLPAVSISVHSTGTGSESVLISVLESVEYFHAPAVT